MTRILGAVLAGGVSSRFGSDKALALFGGRSLLDHAAAALGPHVDAVVVVGRVGGVADVPAPGLGPLGGIAGALDHAARQEFDSVLTIGCDMPAVPPTLLAALAATPPRHCADAPVLGHWPVAATAALVERLARHRADPAALRGLLSVRRWAEAIGSTAVAASEPIANVNTPADLPA